MASDKQILSRIFSSHPSGACDLCKSGHQIKMSANIVGPQNMLLESQHFRCGAVELHAQGAWPREACLSVGITASSAADLHDLYQHIPTVRMKYTTFSNLELGIQ
jgi:hypothetical protein